MAASLLRILLALTCLATTSCTLPPALQSVAARWQLAPRAQAVTPQLVSAGQAPSSRLNATPRFVSSNAPTIRAQSWILLDAISGEHLASQAPDKARPVASTQKLLTALVVLDAGDLEKPVRVQAADTRVEPTVLGLRAGETYTRRNLLYAFLIRSCNDVGQVLARDNAGSLEAFAARMNAKAQSLGCTQSRFRNPHGLPAAGQYSSARDMARIALAAYRHPVIRDIVRRSSYQFRRQSGSLTTLQSTNHLLGALAICNGMKTGYTRASGRCLVSSASASGRHVILVQLGTKTTYLWDDASLLMQWGLQHCRPHFFLANNP